MKDSLPSLDQDIDKEIDDLLRFSDIPSGRLESYPLPECPPLSLPNYSLVCREFSITRQKTWKGDPKKVVVGDIEAQAFQFEGIRYSVTTRSAPTYAFFESFFSSSLPLLCKRITFSARSLAFFSVHLCHWALTPLACH